LKKLLKLKEWLTVPDAARHLSILFGEEVREADVLRLALDGHLTLSVLFVNHTEARCGPIVPLQDAKRFVIKISETKWFHGIEGLGIGEDGKVLELGDSIVTLTDVWDLTMLGAERLDVEHKYQRLTSGPAVDLVFSDGPIVSREDGTACQLVAHFADNEFFDKKNLRQPWNNPENFYPAHGLPSDSVLVVRTTALRKLESFISELDKAQEKPIERRERTTLLVMIAALAKLAKIDVAKPSSAATAIESQTALMGARIAARTIENHLKRVSEALDSRGED
jgi:hypothetical protein